MGKITTYIFSLTMIICMLTGCGESLSTQPTGNAGGSAEKSGSQNSDTIEVKITDSYQFFQGEDDKVKSHSETYNVKKGDTLKFGGLEELEIKVTAVSGDSMTFKTSNDNISSSGSTDDIAKEFTVTKGTPLKLNDLGLCDVACWYEFQIGSDSENVVAKEDDMPGAHTITIVKGEDLIVSCPEKSYGGGTVEIETFDVTDADIKILVNGEDICKEYDDCKYFFSMPNEDVEITVTLDTSNYDV